jgi:hypothetical protein
MTRHTYAPGQRGQHTVGDLLGRELRHRENRVHAGGAVPVAVARGQISSEEIAVIERERNNIIKEVSAWLVARKR